MDIYDFMKTFVLVPPGTVKTTTLLIEVDKYLNETEGNDMGYEIMDAIGDNFDIINECYVVSKEELMDKIKHSAKYEYRWEEFEDIDDNGCQIKGTKIHKIERKVGK